MRVELGDIAFIAETRLLIAGEGKSTYRPRRYDRPARAAGGRLSEVGRASRRRYSDHVGSERLRTRSRNTVHRNGLSK